MVVKAGNPSTTETEAGVPRHPNSWNAMYEKQVQGTLACVLKKKKKRLTIFKDIPPQRSRKTFPLHSMLTKATPTAHFSAR